MAFFRVCCGLIFKLRLLAVDKLRLSCCVLCVLGCFFGLGFGFFVCCDFLVVFGGVVWRSWVELVCGFTVAVL